MSQEENVKRIIQVMEWFPGCTLGLPRQVGKTEAIIRMVHDEDGLAAIVTPRACMADEILGRYAKMYPGERVPLVTSNVTSLRGQLLKVFVDEPWFFREEDMKQLGGIRGKIVGRIGTPDW